MYFSWINWWKWIITRVSKLFPIISTGFKVWLGFHGKKHSIFSTRCPLPNVYLSPIHYVSRVQELCESRGGCPELSVLMSLMVSVDVKQHWTMHMHWSQFVPNMSADIQWHEALHHHHHILKLCWLSVCDFKKFSLFLKSLLVLHIMLVFLFTVCDLHQ